MKTSLQNFAEVDDVDEVQEEILIGMGVASIDIVVPSVAVAKNGVSMESFYCHWERDCSFFEDLSSNRQGVLLYWNFLSKMLISGMHHGRCRRDFYSVDCDADLRFGSMDAFDAYLLDFVGPTLDDAVVFAYWDACVGSSGCLAAGNVALYFAFEPTLKNPGALFAAIDADDYLFGDVQLKTIQVHSFLLLTCLLLLLCSSPPMLLEEGQQVKCHWNRWMMTRNYKNIVSRSNCIDFRVLTFLDHQS